MSFDVSSRDNAERTANVPAIDLSSVIARTIEEVRDDPAQLRNAIYELARIKLQKEAWASNMSILAARRLMLALETAIERVETISSQQDELLHSRSQSRLIIGPASDQYYPLPNILDPAQSSDHAPAPDHDIDSVALPAPPPHPTRWPWWRSAGGKLLLRASVFAVVAIAGIFILGRHFALFEKIPSAISLKVPKKGALEKAELAPSPAAQKLAAPPSHSPALPLPTVYGVYALSRGQLYELEALPIRVPDQRVLMSAMITTASRTRLPFGRLEFIVYRRDIATSAPERIQARVIAKIARAMSFNKVGQTNIASVEDQWAIRGNSYDLRVAPVSESAEMLMIRPENSDFVFPAGRYGLVLKGQAYDFTVAGRISEAAQCLERIEAANGGFYSECRNP
jgi:hypothetical protein